VPLDTKNMICENDVLDTNYRMCFM